MLLQFDADYTTPCATLLPMNTTELLSQIEGEISLLNRVRALLAGTSNGTRPAGRPVHKKRFMSAESREKIAAAQRKRWAKQKAAK